MTDESLKEEILINVTPSEVRAALLENGVLQEVYIERAARRGLISNIYKGRVLRVLPGMQAAFVDIGMERTAFLHASDIAAGPPQNGSGELPNIRDLVREGDEIMVQVVKDPLGNKGARLTTFITLPSRHLVLLPRSDTVGISARIEDEDERERLRLIVEEILAERGLSCGAIVRTVAEGMDKKTLDADLKYTVKLWEVVQERCSKAPVKMLVHEDLSLPLRILRDMVTSDIERILVDSEEDFHAMQDFADTYLPDIEPMLELYKRRRPIFDLHGIEDEIRKSLDRNIPLKSGGYLIFDQTEAMTTVDINTGGYVGHRNLEETIYRTNLEAAVAIARQLRLRNLGGIIIIDFIHRHGRTRSSRKCPAGARAVDGQRPRATSDYAGFASGPGRNDAKTYARKPAAHSVRGLPGLRGSRLRDDSRNRLFRDFSRNHTTIQAVRVRRGDGSCAPGCY
jgi:ribonuclease G